jgi:hypothetical protein
MALILRFAPAALLFAVVQLIALLLQGSDHSLPRREKATSPAAGNADSWELRGTVVTEDGKPVPQASVTIRNFKFLKTIRPAADGSFAVTVPKPLSSNFAVFAQDENGSRRAAFLVENGRPIRPSVSTIRLELRKAREVVVLVTDQANRPVEGATVGLQSRYVTVAQQTTDRQGQTRLQFAASLPVQSVYAFKGGEGLDYCLYRSPDDWAANPYARAQDDARPLTLKLAGARPVLVRVTQTGGPPVAGVRVRAWFFTLPNKGQVLNLGSDAIVAVTDGDGKASFPQIPINNEGTIIFHLETQDYFVPDRLEFEPKSKSNEIVGVVAPWEHVHGKVIFANGRPGRGAKVAIEGGGYQSQPFTGEASCDNEGRFEARVARDQYVLFRAKSGIAISEVQTRVVRAGLPTKPLNLVMEPATRVHGTVTVGKLNRPVPRQQLVMILGPPIQYDQLPQKEQILAKPEKPRHGLGGVFLERTATDEQGRYELFVGPGKYGLSGPRGSGGAKLNVRVQPEIEHNFHDDGAEDTPLLGRVVLRSNPTRGVGWAEIQAESVDPKRYRGFRADCDADGKFRVRRDTDLLIRARTADRQLAGFARVSVDDDNVTIPIGPCASVHGRLIDIRTGGAIAHQRVSYGISIHYESGGGLWSFADGTTTDSRGEFTLTHLATGRDFQIHVDDDITPHKKTVRAEKAERLELGDIKVEFERERKAR